MLKIGALLQQADDLVESAWRERKWPSFAIWCLAATVGIMIVLFAAIIVGGAIYLEASRLYWVVKQTFDPAAGAAFFSSVSSQYGSLLNFALGFAAITGIFAVVSAVPAMVVKSRSGASTAN